MKKFLKNQRINLINGTVTGTHYGVFGLGVTLGVLVSPVVGVAMLVSEGVKASAPIVAKLKPEPKEEVAPVVESSKEGVVAHVVKVVKAAGKKTSTAAATA